MSTRRFNTMKDLRDYVNEQGISQDRIVQIFQSNEGEYVLVYFE